MKRNTIFVIVVLALLAAGGVGVYQRYLSSPLGRVVVDLYFEGIILDPTTYPVNLPPTTTWEISPKQIRQMESKLISYVGHNKRLVGPKISNELRYYRRHYLGLLGENRRKMISVYFCHDKATNRDNWLQHHITKTGGGDSYWHITYEVRTGWFGEFFSNQRN